MKNAATLLFLLLITGSGFSQVSNDQYSSVTPIKQSKSIAPNTIDRQWQSQARQYITELEYSFKKDADDAYAVVNNRQRLSFEINNAGYRVKPVAVAGNNAVIEKWKADLAFLSISKGEEELLASGQYSTNLNKNELKYNYPGFSIQYINNEKGLRQNFIITTRPSGSEYLELSLQYSGSLIPELEENGIRFRERNITKLFYNDLKVWDADHRPLKARLELSDDNIISIVVDDQNAKYPITIDPLNKVPDWTGTAEGVLPTLVGQLAIDAAYGYTVAGIGDVNNDGFDDVAIGAPAMADVISGTGSLAAVGAVFVYYGSSTGLPVAPSVMLQPTTVVAGALFGYSIAGGDVNNDGNNDIIVGAPLDNIIVNGQSGTVGKVYAFDGATLSTSTTPFLNIQLSGNTIIKEGINLSVNALFGFSVAVTEDLNADGKNDIIAGAPTYAGIKNDLFGFPTLLDVRSGGAFIFLTNAVNNNLSIVKLEPIKSNLLGILSANIDGLLFGYSVDGLGDYNNDGHPDVVATAPAGIDLGLISILLNGKLLQGSATVYYGTGAGVDVDPGAVLTATSGGLLTNLTGTISNIANLFGTAVRGVRDENGIRNGNLIVGAPLGGTIMNVLGLELKTGTVSVFVKKSSSPAGNVIPDQVLSSERNTNTILGIVQCNLLFGYSLDNIRDVNCDGVADIIIGEPASSGANLLNVNATGGAAYIYFGQADGTYYPTPYWTLTATADGFLGINGTSLVGYSVAGIGKIKGSANSNFILTGSPSRTLDLGIGLLNLGNTFGTLFGLVAGDNGVGKSFVFEEDLCSIILLPVTLKDLKVFYNNGISQLSWSTAQENNSSHFEIERSTDGTGFSTIGRVTAAGYSNQSRSYTYNDINPATGINYYRLKMMDKDGHFAYSNIVQVNVKIKGNIVTTVYPRPFVDKLNIVIANETASSVNIDLIDNTGKLVVTNTKKLNKGFNTIILNDLNTLAGGFYILRIKLGENVFTQKLVK